MKAKESKDQKEKLEWKPSLSWNATGIQIILELTVNSFLFQIKMILTSDSSLPIPNLKLLILMFKISWNQR